jgi:hypothetical protein
MLLKSVKAEVILRNYKENLIMKKYISGFLLAALFMGSVTLFTPVSAQAQTRYVRKVVDGKGRVRWVPVKKPSFYRLHRNKINMGIGTAGGAVIGGLINGKKGALIGAGTGLAGSALYTYKIKKGKRVYKKVKNY